MIYNDFTQIKRAYSNQAYIHSAAEMIDNIPSLIEKTELRQRPCRLCGLSVSNLINQNEKTISKTAAVIRDFWGKEEPDSQGKK